MVEVSGDVLANCLGVTPRRVQVMAKEGILVKVRRGVYSLEPSVQGYIAYKLDCMEQSQEEKSLDEIRAAHEAWKMRKTQIAVRLMEGTVQREVAGALNELAAYDPADYADPLPLEDEEEEEDGEQEGS